MKICTSFGLFLFLVVSMSGCATTSKIAHQRSEAGDFEGVKIGDSSSKVTQLWGAPAETAERFGNTEYRVLQFADERGIPVAMFSLDPNSQLVAGKAKWTRPQDQESNLEYVLKHKFTGASFKTYIPCETRSPKDEVLVNRERGIFLFRRMDRLLMISWADQTLTNLRIGQFYKQCPKLQIEK